MYKNNRLILSSMVIRQRIEKTSENKHGFQYVEDIPYDKPSILFLGGVGTELDENANGYLSRVEEILKQHGIKKHVGLYAVLYDFGVKKGDIPSFEDVLARKKMFTDHLVPYGKSHIKIIKNKEVFFDKDTKTVLNEYPLSEDTLHPKYIDQIFKHVFLTRICDEYGKKLPVEEACKRMRNLTVLGHCHGAYTFLKIEEKLQEKMQSLGFSKDECAQIQKELLCITYAPEAPLGISKSTMVSFASAGDIMLQVNNNFSKTLRMMNFKPAYFPKRQGEVFVIKRFYENDDYYVSEHNFLTERDFEDLTKNGRDVVMLSSNAIANAVKNSIEGGPLPSVEELVCGQDERCKILFYQFKENGRILWDKIGQKTVARLSAYRKQKSRE